MTLAGGAIFGLWVGVPVAVISASIGATLAFWMARYVFRDMVQRHFGNRLAAIDAGIKRDGAFYLFTLRLIPVFPFFVINVLMGLTAIRTATFFWVSLVGMLAGTTIYANAGTQKLLHRPLAMIHGGTDDQWFPPEIAAGKAPREAPLPPFAARTGPETRKAPIGQ